MTQRAAGKSFAEIAKAEGVSTDELLAEATRIETAELDAAVKAGAMTAAERTQELAGLQARLKAAVTETGALPADGGPGHGGRGHGGGGDIAEALAKLSGTDVSTIMQKRAAGTSFAQIAKAEGVATDELLAEATRIETAELDAAVKAGTMTAAERTQILSGLQARLKEELSETHTLPAERRPRVRPRRRRPAGPPRRWPERHRGQRHDGHRLLRRIVGRLDADLLRQPTGSAHAGRREKTRRLTTGAASSRCGPPEGRRRIRPPPAPPTASARRRGWTRW